MGDQELVLSEFEIQMLMGFMNDGRTDCNGDDIYVGDIFKGSQAHTLYHKLLAALRSKS